MEGKIVDQHLSVKRYCFTLDLKDDDSLIAEYRYYHAKGIWPEILQGLSSIGIYDMEIYLTHGRMFMILDVPVDFDYEKMMGQLATMDRQQEWEEFMWKFQQRLPWVTDNTKWIEMERIFSFQSHIKSKNIE